MSHSQGAVLCETYVWQGCVLSDDDISRGLDIYWLGATKYSSVITGKLNYAVLQCFATYPPPCPPNRQMIGVKLQGGQSCEVHDMVHVYDFKHGRTVSWLATLMVSYSTVTVSRRLVISWSLWMLRAATICVYI